MKECWKYPKSWDCSQMDTLSTHTDERGTLTVVESGQTLPFEVKRAYWIYDVPKGMSRGRHANFTSFQYLVAVKGYVRICMENKEGKKNYCLDSPSKGLLIPPYTWNELLEFSEDAVLLVLSSQHYDRKTYIDSYEEFLTLIK